MVERYRPVTEPAPSEPQEKTVRGRPFEPGNPGRPVGAKNKTTRLLEQLMADEAPNLIRKVIDGAKGGKMPCPVCRSAVAPARRSTGRLYVAGGQQHARRRRSHGCDHHWRERG